MFEQATHQDVDVDSPPARAVARAGARVDLHRKHSTNSDEVASPEAAVKAYRKLSDMRTSQLQQRMEALSQRDPRLGVTMVLARSPKSTKEQAARALRRSNGDVEQAILKLSQLDGLSPDPPPIEMTLPKDIDLDVTPRAMHTRLKSDGNDNDSGRNVHSAEHHSSSESSSTEQGELEQLENNKSLAVAQERIQQLEAQVQRLQAVADLEKQEKLILIEDMSTMHQLQKDQIEQDRRHLQQMDETNEQLCQDLILAEEELTLLRNSAPHDVVDTDGEFDNDGLPHSSATVSSAALRTTPPRQSSVEMEAALAWEEKAALEATLRDTQRELAELRHPPEPESASGFFTSMFAGSSKKNAPTLVNDSDIHAAVTQVASHTTFPGSAASRTAEIYRRLHAASSWLQLASSSSNETVVGRDGPDPSTVDLAWNDDDCGFELSQPLMDLVSPGSAVISREAEANAVAETVSRIFPRAASGLKSQVGARSNQGKIRVYRCVARTTVREKAEVNSAKTGILAVGDEIEAIEEREIPIDPSLTGRVTGITATTTTRVRCHLGWVSKVGVGASRKATQDRQQAPSGANASCRQQLGTPILEEIRATSLGPPTEEHETVGERGAALARQTQGAEKMVPAHAGLVLGGPYTTDMQVLFCPALRWEQGQSGNSRGCEGLNVSWLRRYCPETEGEASTDEGPGDWIPIPGAHSWSYTPCATDVDCELQAVVRSICSYAESKSNGGLALESDQHCLDTAQNAQQARLNRLARGSVGNSNHISSEDNCDGASQQLQYLRPKRLLAAKSDMLGSTEMYTMRPLCTALSPPLRLDPLIASQVEAWIGADGSKDVSFAVKRAHANSRLTIHGKDKMVTLHLGPRPMPDEHPVWAAPLAEVAVLLSQFKSKPSITLRNSIDGSVGSCTVTTYQMRERVGATILFAQKKARRTAAKTWF